MTTITTDTSAWNIKQGHAFLQTYTLTESDGSTPIDISADTITLFISHTHNSEAILQVDGDVATLGYNGQVTITLTEAQTQALTAPNYVYEVVWDDGNGNVQIATGEVLIAETMYWR